jgi:F-type H+-transporting ATPase subunit delta
VSAINNGTNLVAVRYASALLDMAAEQNLVQQVENDMVALASMMNQSEDLKLLINNPLNSRDAVGNVIAEIARASQFNDLTIRFLGVLAQNRRLNALEGIFIAFKRELQKRRGVVEAKVETAFALTVSQEEELKTALTKAIGSPVSLDLTVNNELLGGMTVIVGSRMIDDSVRSKLARLQSALTSGSNQNQQIKKVG